ncbi:MAG: hypothetical protein GX795_12405 [Firmicutes bacterium]|nr:hypothetical protein [Bacillota bacterium]
MKTLYGTFRILPTLNGGRTVSLGLLINLRESRRTFPATQIRLAHRKTTRENQRNHRVILTGRVHQRISQDAEILHPVA